MKWIKNKLSLYWNRGHGLSFEGEQLLLIGLAVVAMVPCLIIIGAIVYKSLNGGV